MSLGKTSTTKALIGFFGGPLSGAYYGYNYAQNQNALASEEGKKPNSSAFLHTVIGLLFSPISGVVYGIQCAEQETKLADLQEFNTTARTRTRHSAEVAVAHDHQQTRWQDHVQSERATTHALHR